MVSLQLVSLHIALLPLIVNFSRIFKVSFLTLEIHSESESEEEEEPLSWSVLGSILEANGTLKWVFLDFYKKNFINEIP